MTPRRCHDSCARVSTASICASCSFEQVWEERQVKEGASARHSRSRRRQVAGREERLARRAAVLVELHPASVGRDLDEPREEAGTADARRPAPRARSRRRRAGPRSGGGAGTASPRRGERARRAPQASASAQYRQHPRRLVALPLVRPVPPAVERARRAAAAAALRARPAAATQPALPPAEPVARRCRGAARPAHRPRPRAGTADRDDAPERLLPDAGGRPDRPADLRAATIACRSRSSTSSGT